MTTGQRMAGHLLNAAGILIVCVWVLCVVPTVAAMCDGGLATARSGLVHEPKLWLFAVFLLGGAPAGAGLMIYGDFLRGQYRDSRDGTIERRFLLEGAARAALLLAAAALLGGFWSGLVHGGKWWSDWIVFGCGIGLAGLAIWCARGLRTTLTADAVARHKAARSAPLSPKILASLGLLVAVVVGLASVPPGYRLVQIGISAALGVLAAVLFLTKPKPS